MMKIFLYISLTLCAIASTSIHATPVINGIAVHSELGQESFIGALLLTNVSTDADAILNAREKKQIEVRILENRISSRRFKQMWIGGMAINASSTELASHSQNMATFSNLLPTALVKNDIFTIRQGKYKVRVSLNGAELGEIHDYKFFDVLLRTWIGEIPLSSTFRDQLLAGGTLNPALLSQFNQTKPSEARIKGIKTLKAQKIRKARNAKKAKEAQSKSKKVAARPAKDVKAKITPPVVKPPSKVAVAKPKPVAPPEDPAVEATELDDENEVFTAESLLTQQLYIAELKKWTYKYLHYPKKSLEKNEEGVIRLTVTIKRDGKIENINTTEAPKFSRLTKAAIGAVEKSAPYPVVPDTIKGDLFTFPLPISFKLVD